MPPTSTTIELIAVDLTVPEIELIIVS